MADNNSDKSLTAKFDIEGDSLNKALSSINADLKKTDQQLKLLKDSLKLEWDNENFTKALVLANQRVELSAQRVNELKRAIAEADKQGVGKTAEAYEELANKLLRAQNETLKYKQELDKINQTKLDKIKSEFEQIEKVLMSSGKKLTASVTAPLAELGSAAISTAGNVNASVSKVEAVFDQAAAAVLKFSEIALLTQGLSRGTVLEMSSFFGDMAVSIGYSKEEAAAMSIELVKLASDLASFKNISVDEARTALAAVFTGETEALKELGVVMTEANLQEYALAEGISQKVSELSQAEKAQLRYNYVMENTVNAQGDFARTSDSTANQLRIFQESAKELGDVFGQVLLPMIAPIIRNINELLQGIVNLDDQTKQWIVKIAVFTAALGPMLTMTGNISKAVEAAIIAYNGLKAALIQKSAADTAATASQTALNTAMAANPAGAIAAAIGVLIAVLGSFAVTAALTGEQTFSLNDALKDAETSYNNAAEAAENNRQSSLAEISLTEELIPRFQELNDKVNKTTAEKTELKNIVDKINEVLPNSISLIDEETGKYLDNTEAVIKNAKAKIEAKAAEERALAAAKSKSQLEDEFGISYEKANELYEQSKKNRLNAPSFLADFADDYNLVEYGGRSYSANQLKDYISQMQEYQSVIDKYSQQLADNLKKETSQNKSVVGNKSVSNTRNTSAAAKAAAEAAEKAKKEAEEKAKQALKDLEELKRKQTNAIVEQLDAEKKAAKEAYDYKIKLIDEEIAKRKQLSEEADKRKEIEVLKAQVEFERNAENKIQLQRQLDRLLEEQRENEWLEQKEQEKSAWMDWYNMQIKLSEEHAIAAAQKIGAVLAGNAVTSLAQQQAYQNYTSSYSYDNRTNTVILNNGTTLTSAALADLLNKA